MINRIRKIANSRGRICLRLLEMSILPTDLPNLALRMARIIPLYFELPHCIPFSLFFPPIKCLLDHAPDVCFIVILCAEFFNFLVATGAERTTLARAYTFVPFVSFRVLISLCCFAVSFFFFVVVVGAAAGGGGMAAG